MLTIEVSLPEELEAWVELQLASGVHGNASEYIGGLIRKDQQRQMAAQALQAAITQGEESGEPRAFNSEEFKRRMRDLHSLP